MLNNEELAKMSLQELYDYKKKLIEEFNKNYYKLEFLIDSKLHYEDNDE